MKYNNAIETLRCHCAQLSEQYTSEYHEASRSGRSLHYMRYLVTGELHFKLGTLIDREFGDFADLKHTVLDLMTWHLNPTLTGPLSPEESGHVRIAETAFLQCLDQLSPDCPHPDVRFDRNIMGREAEQIGRRFRQVWGYEPRKYWYPLTGAADADKLFIMTDHMEAHFDEICRLIGIPGKHIIAYGESWYPGVPACAEVEALDGYGGCEVAYTDPDFTWIIYFSHEDTVTFAGSILPGIRRILKDEKAHWNRWETA